MKNLTQKLVLACLFLISTQTYAQEKFMAGGKIGLGMSKFPELNESAGIVHFAFGGSFSYKLLPFFEIAADVLFTTTGDSYKGSTLIEDPQGFINDETYTGDIRITTLSIPIYPQIALGNGDFRILLNGGVATNLNLFASESRDYTNDENNENVDDLVKGILEDYTVASFAALYGIGGRYKFSKTEFLQVDLRYTMGLNFIHTTTNNTSPKSYTRDLYTISVSYFF